MASRHRSRELAVQLCYQWDLDPKSLLDPRVTDRFWKNQAQASTENWDFFEVLVKGVADNLPYIDSMIERVLDNWKMERIEKVDLAVLRVAVFEMVFEESNDKADDAVIINEAIEICKVFGNQGSPSFVNGILDAIAKNPELRKGRVARKPTTPRSAETTTPKTSALSATQPSPVSTGFSSVAPLERRSFKIAVRKGPPAKSETKK